MTKNKLIAITGGIGSGKTEASKIIKGLGYNVISCDEITKKLYKTYKVKRFIKKSFPSATTGRIFITVDKKKLSDIVFSSPEKNKILTDYLTTKIFDNAIKTAKKLGELVFIEVPLLFERDYQNRFDKVIVLLRNKSSRIESVKVRSNLSNEEIEKRISSQVDYDKIDLSEYIIIENNGDVNALKEKVIVALKNI